MKKLIQISVLFLYFFTSTSTIFAQEKSSQDLDGVLKETIYKKYKKEVLTFDKKQFAIYFLNILM